MTSILDVTLACLKCHGRARLGDCVPCIGPDGADGTGYGCPVPDCGGVMREVSK